MQEFRLVPIGTVRSPFTATGEIPKGLGAKHEAEGTIDVLPELEAGLADIEGFSHLYVLWVFDRVEGIELVSHPPNAMRSHGVFATEANAVLAGAGVDEILVTDSIPPWRITDARVAAMIRRVGTAPFVAEAIRRLHAGTSLAEFTGN